MEEVVAAAPGFGPRWKSFFDDSSEEEHLPYYVAMGELAHYVVGCYESDETTEFAPLFALVEQQFTKNDRELENLLQVGLFESMQNIASHREFGVQVFRQWLGPLSLAAWDEIDAAMREVAEWTRAQNRPRWWQFWRRWTDFNSKRELSRVENPELKRVLEAEFRDFGDDR